MTLSISRSIILLVIVALAITNKVPIIANSKALIVLLFCGVNAKKKPEITATRFPRIIPCLMSFKKGLKRYLRECCIIIYLVRNIERGKSILQWKFRHHIHMQIEHYPARSTNDHQ